MRAEARLHALPEATPAPTVLGTLWAGMLIMVLGIGLAIYHAPELHQGAIDVPAPDLIVMPLAAASLH